MQHFATIDRRDSRDVAYYFFRGFSVSIRLLPKGDAAFINLKNVSEAKRALKEVDRMRVGNMTCDLRFNKPSSIVSIASIPDSIQDTQAKEIATNEFSKYGEFFQPVSIQKKHGRSVTIQFKHEKDASRIEVTREGVSEGLEMGSRVSSG